jgi:hypothetical protein
MQESGNETILSDLMLTYIREGDQESYRLFLNEFQQASVGVFAEGAPKGTIGEFTSSADHPISISRTMDQQGRNVVLVYADPPIFARNYGARFNAEMSGQSILETVLINPDCFGIRVNCATAEVSVIIDREAVESMLDPDKASRVSRPWWKFW